MKYLLLVVILAILALSTHSADTLATTLAQVLAGVSNGADRNGLLSTLNGLNSKYTRQSADFDKWLQETNEERAANLKEANDLVSAAVTAKNNVVSANAKSRKIDHDGLKAFKAAKAAEKEIVAKMRALSVQLSGGFAATVKLIKIQFKAIEDKLDAEVAAQVEAVAAKDRLRAAALARANGEVTKAKNNRNTVISNNAASKKADEARHKRETEALAEEKRLIAKIIDLVKNGSGKKKSGVSSGTSSNWKRYSSSGVYIDIDTSRHGLGSNTDYFTSLISKDEHKPVTGVSSIYSPKQNGFRVYLRYQNGQRFTVADVQAKGWKLGWVGVKSNGNKFKHGVTSKGWTKYSTKDLRVDTRDPFKYVKGHTVFTTMSGTSSHWSSRGASSVYPTSTGFRNYIAGSHISYAARFGYKIHWLSVRPDSNTFHTGASRAWTQSRSGELKIKIDLRSLGLTRTPVVVTSIHGTSSHWTSTGANSIIDPSPEGFTVYLRGGYSLTHAKKYQYELQWAVLKE